jgi:hypothetical protein
MLKSTTRPLMIYLVYRVPDQDSLAKVLVIVNAFFYKDKLATDAIF